MTDKEKLDFVVAEIERRLLGDYNSENNEFDIIAQGVCASILSFAKSVQEQPSAQPSKMSVEAAMTELEEKIKTFSEKTKGESAGQILAEMRGEEPMCEELEEILEREAKDKWPSHCDGAFVSGGLFGAQWQRQKDLKEGLESDALPAAYLDGVEKGKRWMREQMMKGVIDGTIVDIDEQNIELGFFPPKNLGVKEGDKVKVIFVKED